MRKILEREREREREIEREREKEREKERVGSNERNCKKENSKKVG